MILWMFATLVVMGAGVELADEGEGVIHVFLQGGDQAAGPVLRPVASLIQARASASSCMTAGITTSSSPRPPRIRG